MFANLRGTKESGRLFAPPVYTYVVSLAILIIYGLYRGLRRRPPADAARTRRRWPRSRDPRHRLGPTTSRSSRLSVFILLRAFSSGAVALTGVEAISNGVPAFKKPESKNAATTLVAMGLILGTFFIGHLGAGPAT